MKDLILLILFILFFARSLFAQTGLVTRSNLVISSDSQLAYGVGSDGVLNEIRIHDVIIVNRYDLNTSDMVFGIEIRNSFLFHRISDLQQ